MPAQAGIEPGMGWWRDSLASEAWPWIRDGTVGDRQPARRCTSRPEMSTMSMVPKYYML